jgi:hypothetical protein
VVDAIPAIPGHAASGEGRLAALAGHRDRAIESYRQYLGLRTNPEPEMVAEVEQVRDELRKLEQTDTR